MGPFPTKIVFALAILAAGWIGGLLPMAFRARFPNGRFMGWGNAFAAGLFLGTGLIHLLSEAGATWVDLGGSFRMAPTLAAGAFMALLLAEHVLLPHSAHSVVHAHAGEPPTEEAVTALSSPRTPYALLLALSVHSVIAGVALGVQNSLGSAAFIFVAILAHKSSAAFSLGIGLVRANLPKRRARGLLAVFALSTPAGVVAGSVSGGFLRSTIGGVFDATFLSLAAGTFIYIAAVDILQDEFLQRTGRMSNWLIAALALSLTAILSWLQV